MIDDLVESHNVEVIIMLDEFPKMLWSIIHKGNHLQAEEILDELRNIRERYEKRSKLRFIFCGSIGMNLVIKYLVKQFNYAGAPLNNMQHYIVKEMIPDDATLLIRHLMKKNSLNFKDELIVYLAETCSYLPFFIDRIMTQIKLSFDGTQINQTDIDKTIGEFISGKENNSQFKHFTERIDVYYNVKEKRIAHELLRILSKSNEVISSEELLNMVRHKIEAEDFEISDILNELYEDMYVDRIVEDESISYQFRFNLLKKWWKLIYA
jgi:hypothetical protein